MKIQPQNISFNAKYKILKKNVPDQLGDFLSIISGKVARMQQADAHMAKDGNSIVFDIHNRFKKAFEKHLDGIGIKFETLA